MKRDGGEKRTVAKTQKERKKKGGRERWDHYDQVKDDEMAKMRFLGILYFQIKN